MSGWQGQYKETVVMVARLGTLAGMVNESSRQTKPRYANVVPSVPMEVEGSADTHQRDPDDPTNQWKDAYRANPPSSSGGATAGPLPAKGSAEERKQAKHEEKKQAKHEQELRKVVQFMNERNAKESGKRKLTEAEIDLESFRAKKERELK